MGSEHEDRARSVYDTVADAYADHFRATEGEQPLDLAMIDHLVALLPPAPRVLDAGCGAGRMLPYLAARGCTVDGVDLSPEMVRRARQDHPGFRTEVGSLTDLPWPEATFDGVLAWYSTIHSPDEDLPQILGELSRVLRPGGLVLIAFQSGDGVREVGAGFRRRGYAVDLHRWHRGLDGWVERCRAAGLAVEARLERGPVGGEQDAQAFVLARRSAQPASSAVVTDSCTQERKS